MYLDVKEIKDFYYRSTLGRAAKNSINKNLSNIWPETAGLNVVGFGFSLPFLRQYLVTQACYRSYASSNGCASGQMKTQMLLYW